MLISDFCLFVVATSIAIAFGVLLFVSPSAVESADALARLRTSAISRFFYE